MGKICRLSEKPSCFLDTVKLIETAFHYHSPHSFAVDFAPLMDESNLQNCFIMTDEDKVIAHIGTNIKEIKLGEKTFSITMLGGIAVDENYRGQGIFEELFKHVKDTLAPQTTLFILWSDIKELYSKYHFYLCGAQFELVGPRSEVTFQKTLYKNLNDTDQKSIKDLYENSFSKEFLTLTREDRDWEIIQKITSSDLYINKIQNDITEYFFINKGQDLTGIIHEYGSKNNFEGFIKKIASFGKVWAPRDIIPTETLQYQFFLSPGNLELFKNFVSEYTNGQFTLRDINYAKNELFVDFEEETLSFEIGDFLKGVMGPDYFEELDVKPMFICGLDSI